MPNPRHTSGGAHSRRPFPRRDVEDHHRLVHVFGEAADALGYQLRVLDPQGLQGLAGT